MCLESNYIKIIRMKLDIYSNKVKLLINNLINNDRI